MENHTLVSKLNRAETIAERIVGLLGKKSLPEGHGLLLAPCNQVHTLFMRFTIDVVFLDSANTVIKICRGLKPWKFSPLIWGAKAVLEMSEGGADRLEVGDQLIVNESSITI